MTKRKSRVSKDNWPHKRYKDYQKELRDAASAWFESKGRPVTSSSYILAEGWKDNMILDEVHRYVVDNDVRPLHQWLHHGLSSQAMLFNLVVPLITRKDTSPLEAAFTDAGIPWPQGGVRLQLEVEDRNVFKEFDNPQPTSIDLVIEGTGPTPGEPLFVEAKLSEKEFGGCNPFESGNCDGRNPARGQECYYQTIGRSYWDQMEVHGLLNNRLSDSLFCPFASYSQFFREVLYALDKGGNFVLMYDDRNPAFISRRLEGDRGLFPFLFSLLPTEVQSRVHGITIREVFNTIKVGQKHRDWIDQFAEKYGFKQ